MLLQRGGRPGLPSLTIKPTVSVDVKQHRLQPTLFSSASELWFERVACAQYLQKTKLTNKQATKKYGDETQYYAVPCFLQSWCIQSYEISRRLYINKILIWRCQSGISSHSALFYSFDFLLMVLGILKHGIHQCILSVHIYLGGCAFLQSDHMILFVCCCLVFVKLPLVYNSRMPRRTCARAHTHTYF